MLPLMTIPTLPAARLDLGTSLIPVAGLMLLLRALMEGQAWDAIRFSVPVILVTGVCCAMSLRWAVDQFNRESVLFRENEQFGLGIWLRHLLRDRSDTPNFAESMLCAVLILIIGFFGRLFAAMPDSWDMFRNHTIITLIAFIATPAAMMAILLTVALIGPCCCSVKFYCYGSSSVFAGSLLHLVTFGSVIGFRCFIQLASKLQNYCSQLPRL